MSLFFRMRRGLMRTIALVASASASMFAQARPAAPKPAAPVDSFALTEPMRQSWTSDRMRFGIGDIVTILINETTAASANLTDNNNETRKKSMGLSVNPPSTGGVSSNIAIDMGFKNDGDSRKQGQAVRQNNFRSTMSARVIAISPTGMLQIRGHKLVNVDQNQQDVVVTGWVRPQDIAVGSNTVASAQIADAEINYAQKGELGKPRSGILSRIFGALWP